MSDPRNVPAFRELSPDEATAVLARNGFGRLAFSFHDRVDVQPLHYVYEDGWLYGRTREGRKLESLRHNQWVAFEVDEVEGPFEWRSVVVRGAFYPLSPEGAGRPTWEHALALLRRAAPSTFADDDPAPFRRTLFRIAVHDATGRAASSAAGVPAGAAPGADAPAPGASRRPGPESDDDTRAGARPTG
jgi:nitroimidazol reductase NimA-like FMN-containing flavoprotein (pyridoxamine 5'-phosphate oxidase superfamily)